MTRKAVKESAIADHLTDNVVKDYESLYFNLPDEDVLVIESGGGANDQWTMYFDGVLNVAWNENEAVTISPKKKQYHVLVMLQFECTNNTNKYEAYIISLEATLKPRVGKLNVYRDLVLIICQVKGEKPKNRL